MTLPAISVRNLGKMYRLAHQGKRTDSFREAITSTVLAPFRRISQLRGTDETQEEFWALKDVSFDVQPGEVVGIIGRNGAGKSTLLKILSRIVEPTEGEIRLRGRVASLLEVGTGFHPELTGRENIYLNGSILGMKRREIDKKFDEIVDFAEVEKFLDTPVKRYSSGMYVRLAFAVAAHLDPEILIVDEVLAVGDAEFQKKCLGKMKDVATGTGRTVLFVSHNLAAVSNLCDKAVYLKSGRIISIGKCPEVIGAYQFEGDNKLVCSELSPSIPSNAAIAIVHALVMPAASKRGLVRMGEELRIIVSYRSLSSHQTPYLGWVLTDANGNKLLCANNRYQSTCGSPSTKNAGRIIANLGKVPLMPGVYHLSLYMGDKFHDSHTLEDALSIEVIAEDLWGYGKIPPEGASLMWWPTSFELQPEDNCE